MPGEISEPDFDLDEEILETKMAEVQNGGGTEALSQWIANVRGKSARFRRQRRSDLRTVAILSRALRNAEDELVRRQRTRARRWARLQPLLAPPPPPPTIHNLDDDQWQRELQKIDEFFKDLNSVQMSDDYPR